MIRYLAAAIVAGSMSLTAQANEVEVQSEEEPIAAAAMPAKSGFYAGLKLGAYSTTVEEVNMGSPAGLVLGFGSPNSSVELEVNGSEVFVDGQAMTYTTGGFYYSFRTDNPLYFRYRVGFLQQSLSAEIPGSGGAVVSMDSDFGFSASIGGGKRLVNNFLLDVEYTIVEQDVSAFTVGIHKYF